MSKPGQRQLPGPRGPARRTHRFQHQNAQAGPSQKNGRRKPIGPGTDDDGIMIARHGSIVPLLSAADGARPRFKTLKDGDDSPDGQPGPDGAHGENEMEGVMNLAPAKHARQSARPARHRAVLVVVPREVGSRRRVDRIARLQRLPDGHFIHIGYCTGKCSPCNDRLRQRQGAKGG